MTHPYEQLKKLGIELPPLSVPAAAYVPYVQTGSLIFLSGHIAKKPDGQPWVGRLGHTMDTAQGQQAARSICIELLGTLHAALASQGKDLSSVKRIVKLMSLVCSTPDFNEQHLVTNGCSELLAQVFGAAGEHARSAFGVVAIPRGSCVEIEMIAEVS
jgi:enamine deaminase RidA (YjgF/YER057c/UK114 family)